jgi:hypothetical protein
MHDAPQNLVELRNLGKRFASRGAVRQGARTMMAVSDVTSTCRAAR